MLTPPPNKILKKYVPFGVGATIHIGREIQCPTYAGFFTIRRDPFLLRGSKLANLDLLHSTDETRLVLKSLGKIIFKNSLCDTIALIWSIWPLPRGQHSHRQISTRTLQLKE